MSKASTYLALPPDLIGPWAYMDMSARAAGKNVQWAKTEAQKQSLSDHDLTIILSGENVKRVALDLPGVRGKELQSAIEFDLEDRLGASLTEETLCQDRKKPGHVAIVPSLYKDQLAALLGSYQLTPEHIFIDYELLETGRSFSVGERRLKGGLNGYALDNSWQALISDAADVTVLQPYELFEQFHKYLEMDSAAPLDLRPTLGVKAGHDFDWKPWVKFAALILAVTVLPFMFDKYCEARAWSQQAKYDQTQTRNLYQEAAGTRETDPARALSKHLQAGQSSAGFLDMSAVLFAALSDVDGAEIDTMRYDPRKNIIQLSLRYPSFEAGELLEKSVQNRGGDLALGGIRERGDSLIGEASFLLRGGAGR